VRAAARSNGRGGPGGAGDGAGGAWRFASRRNATVDDGLRYTPIIKEHPFCAYLRTGGADGRVPCVDAGVRLLRWRLCLRVPVSRCGYARVCACVRTRTCLLAWRASACWRQWQQAFSCGHAVLGLCPHGWPLPPARCPCPCLVPPPPTFTLNPNPRLQRHRERGATGGTRAAPLARPCATPQPPTPARSGTPLRRGTGARALAASRPRAFCGPVAPPHRPDSAPSQPPKNPTPKPPASWGGATTATCAAATTPSATSKWPTPSATRARPATTCARRRRSYASTCTSTGARGAAYIYIECQACFCYSVLCGGSRSSFGGLVRLHMYFDRRARGACARALVFSLFCVGVRGLLLGEGLVRLRVHRVGGRARHGCLLFFFGELAVFFFGGRERRGKGRSTCT
jgi:hypothetical protein